MQGNKEDVVCRTSKVKKMFSFGQQRCLYENTEVTERNKDNFQSSQVKILNHSCKVEANLIEKVIQVKFKDRYLCIKDVYDFGCKSLHPNNAINRQNGFKKGDHKNTNSIETSAGNKSIKYNVNESENRKKFIFRKINEETHEERKFSRNTKNVAKNCCKAFLQYIKNMNNEGIHAKLKKIISQTKYNNTLIFIIINDLQINPVFKEFLQSRAQKWIEESKLYNKDIHREGVKLYLELIKKCEEKGSEMENEENIPALSHKSNQYFIESEEEQELDEQEQEDIQ